MDVRHLTQKTYIPEIDGNRDSDEPFSLRICSMSRGELAEFLRISGDDDAAAADTEGLLGDLMQRVVDRCVIGVAGLHEDGAVVSVERARTVVNEIPALQNEVFLAIMGRSSVSAAEGKG